MANIVTLKTPFREDWLYQLGDVITDPDELLTLLALNDNAELQSGREARRLFPLRVPRAFVARMQPGDPQDPLLLQVLTAREEFIAAPGFTTDPLDEQRSVVPGLLHKYNNRALLLVKGGCAVTAATVSAVIFRIRTTREIRPTGFRRWIISVHVPNSMKLFSPVAKIGRAHV